jgi:hypothetical protein
MLYLCGAYTLSFHIPQQLVGSLSATDYNVNLGVLQTAHSVFRPWRALVRSDELFTEINLVINKFMSPFLQLFRQTANFLLASSSPPPPNSSLLAEAQRILIDIFYDFTCQDLPPDIEDAHEEFFAPQNGWYQRFLIWDPPELRVDVSPWPLFPLLIFQCVPLSSQVKLSLLCPRKSKRVSLRSSRYRDGDFVIYRSLRLILSAAIHQVIPRPTHAYALCGGLRSRRLESRRLRQAPGHCRRSGWCRCYRAI